MKVIRTGGYYLISGGLQTWTRDIEKATRFPEEVAQAIVLHITKGPPDPKGNYSPSWKWVQSPVSVGKIVGYRTEHSTKKIPQPDGSVIEKPEKKLVRFERDERPVFEIVDVSTGTIEPLLDRFLDSMNRR